VKTLFPALLVSNLDASLVFYGHLGYEVVGQVEVDAQTQLRMLALPGEGEVSLELVHRATDGAVIPGGLDHIAVQVDDLQTIRGELVAAGLRPGEVALPGGPDGPKTVEVADPDGHRLELVQWPAGHPAGMTRDDFPHLPSHP
jgi:lactoylglutathione lyase